MSRFQREHRTNPLITRVNQHGALAVLFRAPAEQFGQSTSTPHSALVLGHLVEQPLVKQAESIAATNQGDFAPPERELPSAQLPDHPFLPAPLTARPRSRPVQRQPTNINLPIEAVNQPPSSPLLVDRQPDLTAEVAALNAATIPVVSRPSATLSTAAPSIVAPITQLIRPVQTDSITAESPSSLAPQSFAATSPVTQSIPPTPDQTQAQEGIDDTTWARLKAIYRKHQDQESVESIVPSQAVTQNLTHAAPTLQRAPGQDKRSPGRLEQQANSGEAQNISTSILTQSISSIVSSGAETYNEPASSTSMSTQRQNLQEEQASTDNRPVTSNAMIGIGKTSVYDEVSTTFAKPADRLEGQRQALPLQAVWPVQRAIEPTISGELNADDTVVSEKVSARATAGSAPFTSYLADEVRQRLDTVQTGRPTDSKIDIVTPRRPRPVLSRATVDSTQPRNLLSVQQVVPDLQHNSEQTKRNEPIISNQPATLIETEIGQLPADLWQLIGEKPPSPAVRSMPGSTFESSETAEQNYQAEVKSAPLLNHAQSTNMQAPVAIQRQALSQPRLSTALVAGETASAERAAQRLPPWLPVNDQLSEVGADKKTGTESEPMPSHKSAGLLSAHAATGQSTPLLHTEEAFMPADELTASEDEMAQRGSTSAPDIHTQMINQPSSLAPVLIQQTAQSVANQTASATQRARQTTKDSEKVTKVQRQGDDSLTNVVSTVASTAKKKQDGRAQTPTAEVDLDELARRVYTQIKRRLAVEHERLRRTNG